MSKDIMSLRLSQETKTRLENLAKATGRTKTFLAVQALEEYLELQEWQISAIEEGISSADNSELIEHGNIKQKWEEKRANSMDKAS